MVVVRHYSDMHSYDHKKYLHSNGAGESRKNKLWDLNATERRINHLRAHFVPTRPLTITGDYIALFGMYNPGLQRLRGHVGGFLKEKPELVSPEQRPPAFGADESQPFRSAVCIYPRHLRLARTADGGRSGLIPFSLPCPPRFPW